MAPDDLRDKCLNFLEKFGFIRIEWDGVEMTAFEENGEPFGRGEFIANTPAANAFDDLEKTFSESGLPSYSVSEICDHCAGKGRIKDSMPKSRFSALDWLSYDGEVCNNCHGTGKVPSKK